MDRQDALSVIKGMLRVAEHRPPEPSERAFWLRLRWAAGLFDHGETPERLMAQIDQLHQQLVIVPEGE